ncbi:MAG: formate dehydrogenase [Casimicrobiaceae bacterium]
MKTLRALAGAAMVLAVFGVAMAKLPAPPPLTDAQKAAAEEKKAKDTAAAETAKQQLARAEDRTVARYIAEQKAKGNMVTPPMGSASAAPSAMAAPAAAPGKAGAMPAKAPEAAEPAKK